MILPDWRPYIIAHQCSLGHKRPPSRKPPIKTRIANVIRRHFAALAKLHRNSDLSHQDLLPTAFIPSSSTAGSSTASSMYHRLDFLSTSTYSSFHSEAVPLSSMNKQDSYKMPHRPAAPSGVPPVAAFMKISCNGKSHKLLGIPELVEFDVVFHCKEPFSGGDLSFHSLAAFDAAVTCASMTAPATPSIIIDHLAESDRASSSVTDDNTAPSRKLLTTDDGNKTESAMTSSKAAGDNTAPSRKLLTTDDGNKTESAVMTSSKAAGDNTASVRRPSATDASKACPSSSSAASSGPGSVSNIPAHHCPYALSDHEARDMMPGSQPATASSFCQENDGSSTGIGGSDWYEDRLLDTTQCKVTCPIMMPSTDGDEDKPSVAAMQTNMHCPEPNGAFAIDENPGNQACGQDFSFNVWDDMTADLGTLSAIHTSLSANQSADLEVKQHLTASIQDSNSVSHNELLSYHL
ncbi:hypothetical protein CEUSTIGMA_g1345.t1 [Chlamydomonas eustigma]|uniref:Uncharacterized protein n=1 Tax=Chlamydomonas eustigma TaxID=1157962 RepID=A0A250WSU6_9CHLO|nr:hypothetical protein CEUSTIGMA_g1345.t1 [Chlamydomonas eustigma]|eukprot:GAX73895.1 hypothetical protein CEUSTIGMA_g1345.t1 [Chlamydomonas eustigma]